MGSTRFTLKRSLLLSTFFAAALFSSTAFGQNDDERPPALSEPTTARTTPRASPTQPTTQRTTPTAESTTARATPTETEKPPALGDSTSSTSSATPDAAPTDTNPDDRPPPLTRTQFGIPTYPPPGIPPTNNAPFMNHSTLPDGTVFIAVGAILGAFGLAILTWRGIVGCLLHRSVERAALAQQVDTSKAAASFPAPPAPFYKFTDRDSSPSLPGGGLGVTGSSSRINRKSHRGPTPSATPSQTNLFFSPTAAPSGGVGNRNSQFLPSGFYASASSAPMGGQHVQGNSISLSNLRPASRGHAGTLAPSPPDSPNVRAQSRNFSSSSINLNRPPSGRAPSAFLDDLLDDPAYQGQFPTGQPGQMGPGPGPAPFGPSQGYGQGPARF